MKKPTVYLDTSIISAFWYEGADVAMLARRLHTREWWDLERDNFDIWTSAFADAELRAGAFPRQRECQRMVRRLRYLPVTATVSEVAEEIARLGIVPANKETDAAHLAIVTFHEIDYVLSWNYAHMVNPVVQERLGKLCQSAKLATPLMVSPESIPQVRFGQSIRRQQ
jgi:hypothetical protein